MDACSPPVRYSSGYSRPIDHDALREVWYVFRAIVLHQLWTQRNAIVFEQRSPHSLIQHVFKLYTTFAAHLRYIRRHGAILTGSLDQIIAVLRTEGCGGVVFRRFLRLLATRDVAKLVPLHLLRGIFGCSL